MGRGEPTLVGRLGEIATLAAVLSSASNGQGQVILLEGEPGIGKTRLVREVVQRAHEHGFDVRVGECDEVARVHPFGVLEQALGPLDTTTGTTEPAATAAPTPHFRVVEAASTLVERLAASHPLLLALEDLHWADPSSLAALRSLARRVPSLPVVVLGTLRPGHDSPDLHRVVDAILRDGGARVSVGPLEADAVASLVVELLGRPPSEQLLARIEGAGGNPLFVTEYVRTTQSGTGDAGAVTSPEFRDTVLRRLAALSPPTSEVLRLAAVLGPSFSAVELVLVTGRPVVELEPALHEAVAASVLTDAADRLAFRHALVRDAVYEHIPLAARRRLHREVGQALVEAEADDLAAAHHLALGADGSDPEAVVWLRRAARGVARRAPAIAVDLLAQARALMDPTSPDRQAVLAELASAMAWSGRLAEAEALAEDVLTKAADPSVTGPLRCALVYALTWQGRPREALRYATPSAGEELSERDLALLDAEAAVAHLFSFDLPAARARADIAAERAETVQHEQALCHALMVQCWTANFAGRPHDAVALARRGVAIAEQTTTGEALLAHPWFFPGIPLMGIDRLDEAEAVLSRGLQETERLGLAWSLPLYHAHLGTRRFLSGEWDDSVAEFEAALNVADEVGLHIGVIAATAGWLAVIQVHRDDLDGAEQTLAAAMARMAETGPQLGMGIFSWARSVVLEARGDPSAALEPLQLSWQLFMAGGPLTDPWTVMALVRLNLAAGDHGAAAALLPVIDEQAEVTGTPFMQAQALRCRGLVESDAAALVAAVECYRRCPRPLELAEGCEDAAGALAAAGRLEEAVELWDEAAGLYARLGAERDLRRIRAILRAHGVRRSSRSRHVRATTGWESLTDTQAKVATLVGQRLSNPEVAERLFISRHTVESHLKHVYRKLGVSSRLELAAMVTQQGPDSG